MVNDVGTLSLVWLKRSRDFIRDFYALLPVTSGQCSWTVSLSFLIKRMHLASSPLFIEDVQSVSESTCLADFTVLASQFANAAFRISLTIMDFQFKMMNIVSKPGCRCYVLEYNNYTSLLLT